MVMVSTPARTSTRCPARIRGGGHGVEAGLERDEAVLADSTQAAVGDQIRHRRQRAQGVSVGFGAHADDLAVGAMHLSPADRQPGGERGVQPVNPYCSTRRSWWITLARRSTVGPQPCLDHAHQRIDPAWLGPPARRRPRRPVLHVRGQILLHGAVRQSQPTSAAIPGRTRTGPEPGVWPGRPSALAAAVLGGPWLRAPAGALRPG
jgi:hypothetical protein